MRQSVQALALVTFDVPAAMPAAAVADNIQWALANAKSAPVFSVSAEVRAVREEAAMFNSNGDQWEPDKAHPWHLHKGEERFSVTADFGADAKEPARIARDVAEALNFMAGSFTPAPAPVAQEFSDLVVRAKLLLDAFGGDTPDWLQDEAQALEEAFTAAKTLCPVPGSSPAAAPLPVMRCGSCGNDGSEHSLFIGLDAQWRPECGCWQVIYNEQGIDCSQCDAISEAEGSVWRDGLLVSPGGEVLP